MARQRTLSIIKPDAVEKKLAGKIIAHLQEAGFEVCAMRQTHLTKAQAEGFYAVHKARPFFGELVAFMTRSPVVVMVLEAEDAIQKYRDVIGATDPAQAAGGTIRKLYGASKGENAMHGSDAPETAAVEIGYFFAGHEVAAQAGALPTRWIARSASR
jgi:nucleoside-diphosphate kinase